jgi:acyl-CoA thioester hydrolase
VSEAAASSELRVRYGETDKMGIAHHASYLAWFEVARTDWIRGSGVSYRQLEERDVFLPVLEVSCRYRRPARYDDVLRVETRCQRFRRARLRFDYRITRGGDLIAQGYSVHAAARADGTPRRLPDELVARVLAADGAGPG